MTNSGKSKKQSKEHLVMKVRILSHTENPDLLCAKIGRYSNVSETWDEIDRKIPSGGWGKFLRKVIEMGHTSVLEHAVFTFEITEVSRVFTHQFVRHRIASYLQKSFRRTKIKKLILPPTVLEAADNPEQLQKAAETLYREYYRRGVPMEDARYLAPMGSETAIIATFNARTLLESFFPLRIHRTAQLEIRTVANEMLRLVKEIAPVIFQELIVDQDLLDHFNENFGQS
ncbi:MAG: FAD-dependent thymidylate synthase [Candidatus Thorarchaeota archaeon]